MTAAQARMLGGLIRRARDERGLSVRQLASQVDIPAGWLFGVEAGRFLNPASDRLALVTEVLNIKSARVDRITKGSVAGGLPELRTYFRAKYDLTPEQIEQVERYVRRLRGSP